MKQRGFIKNWLLHSIIAWLLVNIADAFTFIISGAGENDPMVGLRWRFINHNYHQAIWVLMAAFCFAAEYNYHFIFQRYRFNKAAFAAYTIVLSMLFTAAFYWYVFASIGSVIINGLVSVPFAYVLYAGFYIFLRNYFESGKLRAQQLQQQTAAELNTLKAQLNPHFFFNTLNTVYGTALQENAQKTAEMVDKLSSLVRYVMEKASNDITTAGDEIKFIENYFQLQQMRLPARDNIRIVSKLDCTNPSVLFAPLLFIPFIENAFKYGISIDKNCFIDLQLIITGHTIDMVLTNSIIAVQAQKTGDSTGIANVTKRLQLLYPNTHSLHIANSGNTFIVNLSIKL